MGLGTHSPALCTHSSLITSLFQLIDRIHWNLQSVVSARQLCIIHNFPIVTCDFSGHTRSSTPYPALLFFLFFTPLVSFLLPSSCCRFCANCANFAAKLKSFCAFFALFYLTFSTRRGLGATCCGRSYCFYYFLAFSPAWPTVLILEWKKWESFLKFTLQFLWLLERFQCKLANL